MGPIVAVPAWLSKVSYHFTCADVLNEASHDRPPISGCSDLCEHLAIVKIKGFRLPFDTSENNFNAGWYSHQLLRRQC